MLSNPISYSDWIYQLQPWLNGRGLNDNGFEAQQNVRPLSGPGTLMISIDS